MRHAPVEVARSAREVRMACACGDEWIVLLTPAGERKAGYSFTRQCPSAQQDRRTARQHVVSA